MAKLIVGTEAVAAGVATRHDLATRYVPVFRNVYAPRGATLTAVDRGRAAWLWSGRDATVAGLSAAALLGSKWVAPDAPAELVRTQHPRPPGIIVHRDSLSADEVCVARGIPCTTAARTAYDLGRRLPFTQGIQRIDALLNATGVAVDEVAALTERHGGARGIRRLRRVLDLADGGAESPQESRVRLILLRGGLPRPQTQIRVGRRRIDMGWEEFKVGVEYDGPQHWSDPTVHHGDIGRLEFFESLGWRIVRVVAEHVRHDQPGIVHRARRALLAHGYRES